MKSISIFLGLSLLLTTPAMAGLFGGDAKCEDETVALELKNKYCYIDKVAAERSLAALQQQYTNEKANLEKQIQDLNARILALEGELALLKSTTKEEGNSLKSTIKDLEKTLGLLRSKSSSKEKQLLEENAKLRARLSKELEALRTQQTTEREEHSTTLAEVKNRNQEEMNKLNADLHRLEEEINSLKKLSKDQKNELERLQSQEKELAQKLEKEIQNGEIRLKKFHNKLIINVDNRISFDSGKAELKNSVKVAFDKIRKILLAYPENSIHVEGHTDSDKLGGGKYKDNWELSSQRALAVLRYLTQNKAMDSSRFSAIGYGAHHPLVPNDSAANKGLNRRVDIVVVPRVR
ncbi:MAG: OmpA family protein [SAR324 cluster bacterium]|nr:OmpA family protein [SAR324 cluster bacterium]